MANGDSDAADSPPLSQIGVAGLTIHVCGAAALEEPVLPRVTHVVSISDARLDGASEPHRRVAKACPEGSALHEFFDDITTQRRGSPSEPAVRRILAFTKGLCDGDQLLIHCNLGISRSTAIAYAVACQHTQPGREAECYRAVMLARPIASPNILVIRLADHILGRRGLMVRPFYAGGPGRVSLPERCGICGGALSDASVYYEAPLGNGPTVCAECFPSLGICTGYGRCYLLPDGLRDWWFE